MEKTIRFESQIKKEDDYVPEEPLFDFENERKGDSRFCKLEKRQRRFVENVNDSDILLCCNCSFITGR